MLKEHFYKKKKNLREEFERLDCESPFGECFLDVIFRHGGSGNIIHEFYPKMPNSDHTLIHLQVQLAGHKPFHADNILYLHTAKVVAQKVTNVRRCSK